MSQSLVITGMGCQHCVTTVAKALEAVFGVTGVSVDLGRGRAEVEGDAAIADLVRAVTDAGYGAREAETED